MTELFVSLAELCFALGAAPLNRHPGCWEHQIDGRWWVAMNGHPEKVNCSDGTPVDPYTCCVKFNGWVAGILDPSGGVIAAGAIANEETMLEAVRAAIASAKREKGETP